MAVLTIDHWIDGDLPGLSKAVNIILVPCRLHRHGHSVRTTVATLPLSLYEGTNGYDRKSFIGTEAGTGHHLQLLQLLVD
jgi:hypothetical protein